LIRGQEAEKRFLTEQRQISLYPKSGEEQFSGARDLSQAFCDMCEIEGTLEKKRRELALRSDFNMCDVYKLLTNLKPGYGVDCDDLYKAIAENLELIITKDEVFIIFYKLDKDGDGFLNYTEVCDCFLPREAEYAVLIQSRGGFYGGETSTKTYFEGDTRNCLKKFLRGFVECEVSVELIRQRIMNKLRIKPDLAFSACDKDSKGVLTVDDIRNFCKANNMYPIERDLRLMFQRLDKDEDGVLTYQEFVQGLKPFLNGNAE
jgi:Ca2+-binding EF-hand superfamily protein